MNKWTIFTLLKIGELIGLCIIGYLAHLETKWLDNVLGSVAMPYIPVMSELLTLFLDVIAILVICGLYTVLKALIDYNILWAERLAKKEKKK